MTNPTIETDLAEILKRIEDKQDKMSEKLEAIDKRLVKVETRLDSLEENVKEIKSSQQAQIWTLIGVLITAVAGFVIAVARNVLTFN